MLNKLILVSALIVMMLFVSGCTDEQGSESVEDLVVITDLPAGYEYIGSPSMTVEDVQDDYVDMSGIIAAAEGFYRSSDVDLYVDVIEMESPELAEEFVSEYKSGFKELPNGNRFTEESFNDHSVTRIQTYSTSGGKDVPRYTYIWNNENFVFVVGGATEDYSMLRTLAEATGY